MEKHLKLEEIPPVSSLLEADPQYKLIVQLSQVCLKCIRTVLSVLPCNFISWYEHIVVKNIPINHS